MSILCLRGRWGSYTYPFHDESSVAVCVVVVRGGRKRASGGAPCVVGTAHVFRHRAQTRPVAELGTDKPNQTKGTGEAQRNGMKVTKVMANNKIRTHWQVSKDEKDEIFEVELLLCEKKSSSACARSVNIAVIMRYSLVSDRDRRAPKFNKFFFNKFSLSPCWSKI